MKFQVIKSEIIVEGRVFKLRQDEIKYPNGRTATYDIVDHAGAVTLIPIDADGNIWFVRQYRHAAGQTLLELPAGTLDEGEQPKQCAQRELREEIGYSAGELSLIGEFFLAPGYSSEYMYAYVATNLSHDPLTPDEDEFLETECHPWSHVQKMLEKNKIRDAKTIACLFLAKQYLENSQLP